MSTTVRKYKHLSVKEIKTLITLFKEGNGVRQSARIIKRSPETVARIKREVDRGLTIGDIVEAYVNKKCRPHKESLFKEGVMPWIKIKKTESNWSETSIYRYLRLRKIPISFAEVKTICENFQTSQKVSQPSNNLSVK